MKSHESGCKCLTCGGKAQDFVPVDKDVSECGWCGNWYVQNEDGTLRFPNVHEAITASINRSKNAGVENQRVSAEDLDNKEYIAAAITDALQLSDEGQKVRDAIHEELFNMQEAAKSADEKSVDGNDKT